MPDINRAPGGVSRPWRLTQAVILLAALSSWCQAAAFAQGLIVFDPKNYSQNILTATRALDQINNQIRSLQNQTLLIINSTRNLASLPTSVAGQLKQNIDEINRLMSQAKGITFQVEATNNQFQNSYPNLYSGTVPSARMAQEAASRSRNTYEALRQALLTQSEVVEAMSRDSNTLATLMASSSGAIGALQVQQAGNELVAFQIKQLLQSQALSATEFRAQALTDAEHLADAAEAKEQFTRFIGSARAYTNSR